MDKVTLLGGSRDDPYPTDELVMMGFLSEKARRNKHTFEAEPIYFDGDPW